MQPERDLGTRRFAGTWRKYQGLALDAFDRNLAAGDDHSYLVMPPGAGKTMVGLEAARRLGRRVLVLVPNTAVQAQWAATWDRHFPSHDHEAPRCGVDRELSSTLNVLTYQSLAVIGDDTDHESRRSAVRSGNAEGLLKLLHPNGRALIDRAAALGPWTLVLDECHHLLATWGALVNALVAKLGPGTALIGLTATPVTALTEWQRTLHDELFGTADFVVATPALVKEGDLAPYQELVYLTEPTPEEDGWLATDRARFADLSLALVDDRMGSLSLVAWLHRRAVDRSTRDDAQVSWSAFERAEPELALSALRFANSGMIPVPDGARLREQHRVPPDAQDWVTVLTDFATGHLQRSEDPRDAEVLAAIKRVLPGLGYRLTSRGVRAATSPVDRVCALSDAKIAATVHILDVETAVLGTRLRALVLCDFERMTATLPASLSGAPLTDQSGSAQRVTALIAAAGELDPLLVTGRTLACPARIADDFVRFCAEAGETVAAEPFEAHSGLRHIRGGTGFTPRVWVTLATAFFVAGRARVLVGTRALLGEGWDCAAVNVTVDLTSATTAMAITQMRGRAIRLDPADTDKVADNWSVCCVTDGHPRGDADYLRLVRKHDAYYAATPASIVESGVTHCDPTLSPYHPPDVASARAVTALALQRVQQRAAARSWWRIGEPYQGVDVATIRIRADRSPGVASPTSPESALTPGVPGRSRFGSARAALTVGLSGVGAAAGGAAAWTAAGPVAGVLAAAGVVTAGAGLLASATVADALHAAGGTDRGAEALRITPDADGWVRYELGGVPSGQAQLFSGVLDELLAPLTETRYLVGRKVLVPPIASVPRVLFACRAVLGLPLPGAVAWHPVPRWFGRNQRRLGALRTAWERHIGPPRLTPADSPDGQAILELFRGQPPLSLTTQLRTTWR